MGRRYITDLDGYDVYEEMPSFRKPVHIYHGTADGMVPIEYSERAASAFPHALLTRCPGAGHMISASGYGRQVEDEIIREATGGRTSGK